jgi:chemotaxis methyl-accepting protein methylase
MFIAPWQVRLTDEDYRNLAALVAAREGICLGSGVREHITRRVREQMAVLKIADFAAYLRLLECSRCGGMTRDLCGDLEFAHFEGSRDSQQKQFVTEWA